MPEYENHPAATLFPMLADGELEELAQDIRAHGLREPVVLYQGQILDGRNRVRACELAGVEPRTVDLNGELDSPIHYVVSKNLYRRHLTTSQRAAIAAEIVPLLAEEAEQREKVTQFGPKSNEMRPAPHGDTKELDGGSRGSRAVAAKALNVSSTSVDRALRAKRDHPSLFEKAKRGETTVNAASKGITERRRPPAVEKAGTPRHAMRAKAHKDRMIEGLSQVRGICWGLRKLNLALAASACTAVDLTEWATQAEEAAKTLRTFAGNLRKEKKNGTDSHG